MHSGCTSPEEGLVGEVPLLGVDGPENMVPSSGVQAGVPQQLHQRAELRGRHIHVSHPTGRYGKHL